MSDQLLDVSIKTVNGVELRGKKYVVSEPVRLGTFLKSVKFGGYTLLDMIQLAAEYNDRPVPSEEDLNAEGGGVSWWWSYPAVTVPSGEHR